MRKAAVIVLSTLLCLTILFFAFTPSGRGVWNSWLHALQASDDATRYATRKKVEDTCRAMLSSYTSDCLTYAQYKSSPVEEKRSWAEQAKMRANRPPPPTTNTSSRTPTCSGTASPRTSLPPWPIWTDRP